MEAQLCVQQAQRSLQQRNYTEAIALLQKAISLSPEDECAQLYRRLGIVYALAQDLPQALTVLQHAQALAPNDPEVYRTMLKVIQMTGQIDLGISYIGAVMLQTPVALSPLTHLALAELYAVKGDHPSLRQILQTLALMPMTEPHLQLRLWMELGDLAALQELGKRCSARSDQLLIQGIVAELQGNHRQALDHFYDAEPLGWMARLGLARVLLSQQRLEQGILHLQKAHDAAPRTAHVRLLFAHYQALRGHVEAAQQELSQLAQSPVVYASIRQQAAQLMRTLF